MSIPTTDMQRFYWLLYEGSDDREPLLHARQLTLLYGPLDEAALEESIVLACRAHPALCACFTADDGALVQSFDAPPPALEVVDVRALPAEEREDAAARAVADAFERRFDLTDGTAPRRFVLIRLADREAVFVRVFHHIVIDFASSAVFAEDVWRAYRERVEGRAPFIASSDFAAFVESERALREGADADAKRTFWKAHLHGTDVPRPRSRARPSAVSHDLPQRFDVLLGAEARREGVSRSAIVLTRLARALEGWRRGPQAIGYFTANRRDAAFARLVGCAAQWVPIRIDVPLDPRTAAKTCERAFRDALANILPVGDLARCAGRPRVFDLVISMLLLPNVRERALPAETRSARLAARLAPDARPLFEPLRIGALEIVQLNTPMRSAGQTLGLFVTPTHVECEFDGASVTREEVSRIVSVFADTDTYEVIDAV